MSTFTRAGMLITCNPLLPLIINALDFGPGPMIVRLCKITSPSFRTIVPERTGANLMVAPQEAVVMASRNEQSAGSQLPSFVSSNFVTTKTCPEEVGVTEGVIGTGLGCMYVGVGDCTGVGLACANEIDVCCAHRIAWLIVSKTSSRTIGIIRKR